MKTLRKGLQKLPNAKITRKEEDVYLRLLRPENADREYIKALYRENPKLFERIFKNGLNVLGWEDRDLFIERAGDVYPEEMKNTLWQHNHILIINSISRLTKTHNRFPTRHEISEETGLSKQTINKHLKEYFGSELYKKNKEEYLLMRERVLAVAFHHAILGNMKAARVFLEATNQFSEGQTHIQNQQNNFIQINGLTITQEQVKELPETQQLKIMKLLSSLPIVQSKNAKSQ